VTADHKDQIAGEHDVIWPTNGNRKYERLNEIRARHQAAEAARKSSEALAQQRHAEYLKDINDQLHKLGRYMDGEAKIAKPNWADVGDLVHAKELLDAVVTFLFQLEE
jgi:hypothetical protein